MNSPFLRYLNQAARRAKSTSAKGKVLEEATKRFLTVDVEQKRRFDEVWLWKEYPKRNGRRDTGVDLVARKRKYGRNDKTELVAIQCKFYSSGSIGWKDISTFVASCSKVEFAAGILVVTANLTEDALLNLQDIPTIEVWYPEKFDDSNIKWDNWDHRHRPKPSFEEMHNAIRSERRRTKPHIEDLPFPPRHTQLRPRPYRSQPKYVPPIEAYPTYQSSNKKPSSLSPNPILIVLGIIAGVIGVAAAIMFFILVEGALNIVIAIGVVLGIFALFGVFRRS